MMELLVITGGVFGLLFLHTLLKFGIRPRWDVLDALRKHALFVVLCITVPATALFGVGAISKSFQSVQEENALLQTQLANGVMSVYNFMNGEWADSIGTQKAISSGLNKFVGDDTRLYQVLQTGKQLYDHQRLMDKAQTLVWMHYGPCGSLRVAELDVTVECEDLRHLNMTRRLTIWNDSGAPRDSILLPFGGEVANRFSEVKARLQVTYGRDSADSYSLGADSLLRETSELPEPGSTLEKRRGPFEPLTDGNIRARCFLVRHQLRRAVNPGESVVIELGTVWESGHEASVVAVNPLFYSKTGTDAFSMTLITTQELLSIRGVETRKGPETEAFVLDAATTIEEGHTDGKYVYRLKKQGLSGPYALFFIQKRQYTASANT